jgi:regulator of protease activity HflC (stomatin/prohibitin superfamily)
MTSTIIAAVVIFVLFITGFRIAQQYERALVFRFGRFMNLRGPGLFWIIPLGVERAVIVDLRVFTDGVEQQEAMTKDNVPVQANAVIWYRIIKPDLAIIQVQNVRNAIIQVALTTLRNVVGQHSLDDVLKEREKIGDLIKTRVDQVTESWGVEVQAVEMKNIEIPQSMQRAMAQEAEALREKRARIIKAEAEFEAARKLHEAADEIMKTPAALELRRMQMLTEIGAEQNTMTVVMMPSEFVEAARAIGTMGVPKQG